MRDWLFIKEPKCEIGYLLNNQNAKLTKCETGYLLNNQNACRMENWLFKDKLDNWLFSK